jgi:predicted secreted protein
MSIMIGGFHLGPAEDPPTEITATIDDHVVDTWVFDHAAAGASFLRFLRVTTGVGSSLDPFAHLRLTARATVVGRPTPEVAIRQFDAQSTDVRPLMGFGDGWHEAEANPATGLSWRWTSQQATVRVESARDVVLVVRGESPLKYFDAPPTVRITVGDRLLAEYQPTTDFQWRVAVTATALANADGAITITTDKVYLPGQAEGTADPRRLGLRVFSCEVVAGP